MGRRTGFHTQERRGKQLSFPVLCCDPSAWLGEGYYFWTEEDDAVHWGITKKRKTGYYEIYTAQIDMEDVLDTVFNEEHYRHWLRLIENALKYFAKASLTPSLKHLNDFFREKGIYDELTGVMFQDISANPKRYFVKDFQYKKRIQIAVYKPAIIDNFAFHFDAECV